MAFQLSPGVLVTEKDLTNIVPAVATSTGAFAGAFTWGPVMDPTTISSENQLVTRFGRPTDGNATSFFTAANFLSYSNNLLTVRVDSAGLKNAVAAGTPVKIMNEDNYNTNYANGAASVGPWAAKYPGALGNSIKVAMADSDTYDEWTETINGSVVNYAPEFDSAPGTSDYVSRSGGQNDELHILVIDSLGLWTGVKGGILEKFAYTSKASDARKADGANNFYKDVINSNSKYVWWMDHPVIDDANPTITNWGTSASGKNFMLLPDAAINALSGGVDDLDASDSNLQAGFALFANTELYDVSLIPTGHLSATVSKYVIEQVAAARMDCVAFASPVDTVSGEMIVGVDAVAKTIAFRNAVSFNVNSSYGVLDSGWKYQYDRYNDKYRWVPLNGDVAGLCARTDFTNDPWFSPGGLNRGQIKNVVKLNVTPNKTQRDELYKAGINPVVSFPGQGTVLFGDKTLLTKPSAFDRINVRRLFIVLEKAVATAAKFQLFEFNDSFTRAQFRNLVEPFLRDVQGRRGVMDFRVICDDTNNTGEVIDRNEFVADIYIKPNRSINFITLNFVAARTGVSFDEISG